LAVFVGFVKLLHPPDVLRGKAARIPKIGGYVVREFLDNGLSPASVICLFAYFFADLPVQVDNLGIYGFEYTVFGGFYQGED
jgi:hypothetical protein